MFLFIYKRNWKYLQVVFISFYVFTNMAKLWVHTFILFIGMIFQVAPNVYKKVEEENLLINQKHQNKHL